MSYSRKRLRIIYATVLLILTMFPLGCKYRSDIQTQVDNWSTAMFDREVANFSGQDSSSISSESIEVTVHELVQLVSQCDPELNQARFDLQLSEIHKQQVESQKWPRFDLNTSLYVPLNRDIDNFSDVVYGGLFIKYDLLEALFNADATAVAESLIQRDRERQEKSHKRLVWTLMDCLLSIQHYTEEQALNESSVAVVKKGLEMVQKLYSLNKVDTKTVIEWQANLREAISRRNQASEQIALATTKLKYMTGLQEYQNVMIKDINAVSATIETTVRNSVVKEKSLRLALQQRNDIRIAEIDLFLTEMAVLEAKRSSLPRLSFGLGLGSVTKYDNWEDQSFVSTMNIAIPLWDCGDANRRVKKAEIERNRQRQKMVDLVHKIFTELQETERHAYISQEKLKDANQWYQQQKEWTDNQMKLFSVKRLEPLEVLMAELALNASKVEFDRALYVHHQAIVQWKKACGNCWNQTE
jgi:outer membrane protein TolC